MSAQATAPPVVPDTEDAKSRTGFFKRFVTGDLAEARVILALALIWLIFQVQEDRFLSATNLTNLALQITGIGLISVGIVLVLLLGEIDLSVGAVSGLCASIMAVLNVQHGWSPYTAIAAAIVAGVAIGLLQGWLFSYFGIPSFVVTLAGLLAWQGFQLKVLGETGTVNITNSKIIGLTSTFYSDAVGWIVAAIAIGAYILVNLSNVRRRQKAGLPAAPMTSVVTRIVVVAAAVIATIAVFNADRGLPLAVLILLAFVIVFQYIITRTRFGRHIFAVGGNEEAARRAGISVSWIRIVVFGLCSAMAAIGGIMLASRLLAVNQTSGGSDLLLLAIAGPVIAGTSLFGGRGSVWSALLGALVIGSISNGMDLLALESSVKFIVTGGVLLAAVIVDALARKQRMASGRV